MRISRELSEIWKSCKLIFFITLGVRSNKTNLNFRVIGTLSKASKQQQLVSYQTYKK